jgi:hypothetical protein
MLFPKTVHYDNEAGQRSQTQIHQGATIGGGSLCGPHFEVRGAVRAAM